MTSTINIRFFRPEDIPGIHRLIYELAEFEKAPQEMINTEAQLMKDGFGEQALYGAFVAESGCKIVGMSLFYWRYSTWKGKVLYLEDLIVTEPFRGKGIGTLLFKATLEHAKQASCKRLTLQVLDWNEKAIHFYRQMGATLDGEWINAHFEL